MTGAASGGEQSQFSGNDATPGSRFYVSPCGSYNGELYLFGGYMITGN